MIGVLINKRGNLDAERDTRTQGERHMNMKAETGVMQYL